MEQYLLLNIAILPSIDPSFTQSTLEVDYIRIYKEAAVGITENDENSKAKAFPNPVENSINLELHNAWNGRVNFEVFHMSGSLVYAKETDVENGNARLNDLGFLHKGQYLITYKKHSLTETIKFIK